MQETECGLSRDITGQAQSGGLNRQIGVQAHPAVAELINVYDARQCRNFTNLETAQLDRCTDRKTRDVLVENHADLQWIDGRGIKERTARGFLVGKYFENRSVLYLTTARDKGVKGDTTADKRCDG